MSLESKQSGINALKQAEHALAREKEFSRCLLESMADAVVACDADGILTLFNRSAREWHGLDPLRLPPDEWAQHYDLFRSDGITPLPTNEIPLARAFSGESVRDAGMAIKAKGQPIRFILANGSVIRDEAGQKLGAVVIMRDVTEFRRLELELRTVNEELEQRVEERTEELRRTANDLNEAQRIAHLGSWELDLLTNQLSWSDEIYRIFEIDPKEFGASYEAFLQTIHPDDREAVNAAYTNAVVNRTPYAIDHRLLLSGARIKHVHEHCETFYENDKAIRSVGTVQDITGRKRMEDALLFVAQRSWLADKDNFFEALAKYLGEALNVDYVVIDRLDENPDIAETIALYAKGEIVPNMRYTLKGTPCENVMGRRLCVYPQGVQQLFPEDTLLAEMGVESYIGIPLWDFSGQPIGLIALMDRKPLPDVAAATQLLQLVATRAAAELAREQSDRILRTREHEFRTLATSLPDNIVRYDREGRTVYVNPVLEKTLGAAATDMIGKRVREIHPNGDYEAYAQALDDTLASGENCEFELILPIPGKEQIVHHIRMITEHDDHGEVTGVLAIGHDITESKRAEEALHLQTIELEEEVAERQMAQENLQEKTALLEEEIEKRQNVQEKLERMNDELELRVQERTADLMAKSDELDQKNRELERFNKLFVGRELRMVELKARIRELELEQQHLNPEERMS
jgi:PAS domain S-box-containing protein